MDITLEGQLLELDRLKGLSEELKRPSDAINALKEQNKLLALYKEHNDQQSKVYVLPSKKEVKNISDSLEDEY